MVYLQTHIRCLDFQPDPSLQENTMKEELDIFRLYQVQFGKIEPRNKRRITQ